MAEAAPCPGGGCGLKGDQQGKHDVNHKRRGDRPGMIRSRVLGSCSGKDGRLSSGQFGRVNRPTKVGMSRRLTRGGGVLR